MRNVSGDSAAVLPWLLIRQDSHGNRYRVGSYATRAEAQEIADRLGRDRGGGEGHGRGEHGRGERYEGGTDSYLVECRDPGGGVRG